MTIRLPGKPEKEMGQYPDRWDTWIFYLEDEAEKMTAWEIDFIESLSIQRRAGRKLTLVQEERLQAIYDKVQEVP